MNQVSDKNLCNLHRYWYEVYVLQASLAECSLGIRDILIIFNSLRPVIEASTCTSYNPPPFSPFSLSYLPLAYSPSLPLPPHCSLFILSFLLLPSHSFDPSFPLIPSTPPSLSFLLPSHSFDHSFPLIPSTPPSLPIPPSLSFLLPPSLLPPHSSSLLPSPSFSFLLSLPIPPSLVSTSIPHAPPLPTPVCRR